MVHTFGSVGREAEGAASHGRGTLDRPCVCGAGVDGCLTRVWNKSSPCYQTCNPLHSPWPQAPRWLGAPSPPAQVCGGAAAAATARASAAAIAVHIEALRRMLAYVGPAAAPGEVREETQKPWLRSRAERQSDSFRAYRSARLGVGRARSPPEIAVHPAAKLTWRPRALIALQVRASSY